MRQIEKPLEGEYTPYTIAYISLVTEDKLVLEHLKENLKITKDLILSQPEESLTVRCAEGEWTVKEILCHVIDAERVFTYRALRFARNDLQELRGFDENKYVPYSRANERPINEILAEFTALREATVALFESFDDDAFLRTGVVNGNRTSVRALAYIAAGHEMHHRNSIKENYIK